MKNKRIFLFGSSGHAKVIIGILEQNQYSIIGLIDSYRSVGEKTLGYHILGSERDIAMLSKKYKCSTFFVGVGENWGRSKVVSKIKKIVPRANFPNIVHPTAYLGKGVVLGQGSVVMANAVVNNGACVGDFCVINTSSLVEHDCIVGDYSNLASGAILAGGVTIKECVFIGLGARVIEKVSVGKHCLVGAGAVVVSKINNNSVVCGVPAKVVRKRKFSDKVLR